MRLVSLACPLHHVPEPIRARRHVDMLDAERAQRVADRVDNRGARRDRAGLAYALYPKVVGWWWCDRMVEIERRDLSHRRDHVIDHRPSLQLTGLVVVHHFLIKRLADCFRHTAVILDAA